MPELASRSSSEDWVEVSSATENAKLASSRPRDTVSAHDQEAKPEQVLKVLLIGDSGVGKTCLLTRFALDRFEENTCSTVGIDFAAKCVDVEGRRVKLTIWDTAGQERFRTLTSTFYRGAQGVVYVYDVTRRETLDNLVFAWMPEVAAHGAAEGYVGMVVANKVDMSESREVSWEEGRAFAAQHGCLFVETSAKSNIAVALAFEELVLKVLETPALLQSPGGTAPEGGIRLAHGGAGMMHLTGCCS